MNYKNNLIAVEWSTPVGPMVSLSSEEGIYDLRFDGKPECTNVSTWEQIKAEKKLTAKHEQILMLLDNDLQAYFAGGAAVFSFPFIKSGSAFQKLVWDELQRIPYGQTKTYSEIAQAIGRPKAVRATGTACGANKLAIFIPCHRVVAKSGGLGGYAGGLERKKGLLKLETTIE